MEFPFSIPLEPVPDSSWSPHPEGQLSVDIFQTPEEVLVVAPLAGTPPSAIKLHLHKDALTIRAERPCPVPPGAASYYQECFWGPFSRTIILPHEVREEAVSATYERGVLIVRLGKAQSNRSIPLMVVEE